MAFGSKKQKTSVPRRRVPQDVEFDQLAPTISGQFRRNQTLSSYRHNTPEESERQKAHHLALQRRKLGSIFAIVSAAAILLLLLLWQLVAQVHVTTSSKQLSTPFEATDYEAVINDYYGLNPAQRLRFALNTDGLTTYVSSRLPEVEQIKIAGTPGLAQANFTITFRSPVAGWQINSRQKYVDANGVVFEKNYYDAPSVQIIDESGIDAQQGTAIASSRLLGFLGRVVAVAGERGYSVERAILPAGTTREVDVYIIDNPTRIKFSIDRGAGEQVEDMDRVLQFLSGRGITPEHIDVRVSGRAAYQ